MPQFYAGMAGPYAVSKLNDLWDRVTQQLSGTSATALTVGTGIKSPVTQASKQFAVGQSVRITRTSDIAVWMQGIVTAYDAVTGALSVSVDTTSGAGTFSDWTISLTGGSGPAGAAATVAVGVVTTGAPGSAATVANGGTSSAAVLNFSIPRGDVGAPGPANTLSIGAVTTGVAGSAAAASVTGAAPAQTLNLTIPRGDTGLPGNAATIAVGTVTTGAPGSGASVINSGTSAAAVFDITIPRGDPGLGSGDVVGPAASVASEIALFDGATGKLIKRATGSGIATLVSGVLTLIANSTDNITEGAANLYFTAARVRATVLTGLSTAAGTVVDATHTVLQAIGFLQKQISDLTTTVAAKVTAVSVASANGFTGTSSGGTTPALTLTTSVTGLLKGNGTAISAATSNTDYLPPTGPVLSGATLNDGITEEVHPVVDAAGVAISPTNGSLQTWTLTASRTPTLGTWASGQSMTLHVNDGSAFTVTWTTMGIVHVGGTPPTLPSSGYKVLELWKVGTTVYMADCGNVA